ncbi:DUF6279 family lipoprotein [Aliiglaciecola sp. CAU 1673]|uniref:DUF6279 family lipoprotein n=1 Tax=Aliiglaciecola sp. CAU 1673 TaxID=3032595 RepID=UPI0023DADF4C|nr:DUF6279 family lipoprotein [Aliiglaciecola sp. CAU 1673]MDF2177676.1 DUF6279 family lipoprotein [Aliiglaciecola sp. CAU 1673]
MKTVVRAFWVSALLLMTSACSSTFVYNNLDWLVHWYLDDYVDLDRTQKEHFDINLEKWLAWHRSEELARYHAHLESLKNALQAGSMDETQWLEQFELARDHWERLLRKLGPDLAVLITELDDKQVEEMFEELEEENRKEEKKWQKRVEQERLQRRIDNLEEDVSRWIGRLTDQQKALIAEFSPQFHENFPLWMEYRRTWQSQVKALLVADSDLASRQASLEALLTEPRQVRTENYQQKSRQNGELYARLIASLQKSLSDKQRKKLIDELQSLQDDLEDLME